MNQFKLVIKLQLLWLVVAILFHVVSLIRVSMGMTSLSSSPPMVSIVQLPIIVLPILYLGWKSYLVSYAFINGLVFGLLFYMGHIPRIMMYFSPEGISAYPSAIGFYGGMLINTFGIPVAFYGSYLALRLAWKRKYNHPVDWK
ncbi:hypothetical protein EYZ66_05270 [Aequoribacter fuscus]|uniref:hypothetical protein n=1 Tax=Aequoribacter fuscus TaxID=2518989 RepID=UPI0005935CD9|nr:hypothetical protein [Aequoribacter fuscus]QHJ87743.1 hypothetical protein EYZ66_05270 [Aequoribacter fuscus]